MWNALINLTRVEARRRWNGRSDEAKFLVPKLRSHFSVYVAMHSAVLGGPVAAGGLNGLMTLWANLETGMLICAAKRWLRYDAFSTHRQACALRPLKCCGAVRTALSCAVPVSPFVKACHCRFATGLPTQHANPAKSAHSACASASQPKSLIETMFTDATAKFLVKTSVVMMQARSLRIF